MNAPTAISRDMHISLRPGRRRKSPRTKWRSRIESLECRNLLAADLGEVGLISGVKWNDVDRDGVQDSRENGLSDWTIFLDANENGLLDAGEQSTQTQTDDPVTPEDETGFYQFADLPIGDYVVAEIQQDGWEQTFPILPAVMESPSADMPASRASASIVGGEEAEAGAWPWMVSIQDPSIHDCGASLIAPNWVLTAAHCTDGTVPRNLRAVVGRHDLTMNQGEVIEISEIHVHPDFDDATLDADVSLVKLVSPASEQSIAYARPEDAALFAPGESATITGWGDLAEIGGSPDRLHEVTIPIVSNDVANQPQSYAGEVTDNMMAAGLPQGGRDSCQGDSGGPMMVSDGHGGFIQAGIVSWGDGCARPNKYGIYTRIANFAGWIDSIIQPSTSDGSVELDDEIYEVADTVSITVQDSDLVGNGSIAISLTSTSGDTIQVTLNEQVGGVFDGSVTTASGAPLDDNIFQIVPGDTITASYEDADDGSGMSATVTDTANVVEYHNIFVADFEDDIDGSSTDGFTINNSGAAIQGLWHLSTGRQNDADHSSQHSMYYGTGEGPNGGGDYDAGTTAGRITSPMISLAGLPDAELTFNYFRETEQAFFHDFVEVHLSIDGGTFFDLEVAMANPTDGFEQASTDLSAYVGSNIQVRFSFDTVDEDINDLEGWYVDDVTVRTTGIGGGGNAISGDGVWHVQLTAGDVFDSINFGNRPIDLPDTAEISGTKWNDINGDGQRQPGEQALPGWTIFLDINGDGHLNTTEPRVVTASDDPLTPEDETGRYQFEDLEPGLYTVAEVAQDGWEQTFPERTIDPPPQSDYDIALRFLDNNLSSSQQAIVLSAAERWSGIIIGDIPAASSGIGTIDDIVIDVSARFIDGNDDILAQAGPTQFRPETFFPARADLEFDSADLDDLETTGRLFDVIVHEMAHALGFGTVWTALGLLSGSGGSNPRFTGAGAVAEYNSIFGTNATAVPVENIGEAGTRDSHWRGSVLDNELMTGTITPTSNPLSRITIASMSDLGYEVYFDSADDYRRPEMNVKSQSMRVRSPRLMRATAFQQARSVIRGTATPEEGVWNIMLLAGDSLTNIDFGNRVQSNLSTISGLKWHDLNGDGQHTPDEPGLAGWTIYIDEDYNGQHDPGEPSTVTVVDDPSTPQDETGRYSFTSLSLGSYLISEAQQSGWQQTFPLNTPFVEGTHAIDIDSSMTISNINFGSEMLGPGVPDLVATSFSASPHHVLDGNTTVTFSVENRGDSDAAAFDVDVIWSDDTVIGNDDDQVVATVSITDLPARASTTETVSVQLDRVILFDRAIRDDPPGMAAGYASTEVEHISIVVDVANNIVESDEGNNSNRGSGIDTDEIFYFPWGVTGQEVVGPTDAIYVINRIGTVDTSADVNGDGFVAPTDAIAVINRLGYSQAGASQLPATRRPRSDIVDEVFANSQFDFHI